MAAVHRLLDTRFYLIRGRAGGCRVAPQHSEFLFRIEIANVALDKLVSLTKFVREYKYRQIELLTSVYEERKMAAFGPAAVIMRPRNRMPRNGKPSRTQPCSVGLMMVSVIV